MQTTEASYKPVQRKPAHETLEKILAAAEEQLREEGLESFTVQSVLQRADLSVGAFYARFPDKTAIMRELQERVHGRVEPLILSELALRTGTTESLDEAVDVGFGTIIRHVLSDRTVFRAFMMWSVFEPVTRQRAELFAGERKRALKTLLAPHRDDIGHADVSLAIESAYAIYASTMRGRLTYSTAADDTQLGVTDNVLFEDLKRALTLFLRGPAKPARPNTSKTGQGGE